MEKKGLVEIPWSGMRVLADFLFIFWVFVSSWNAIQESFKNALGSLV